MALSPRNERHEWLWMVHQVQTLNFDELTEDMGLEMTERLRIQHTNADGMVLFTSPVWRELLRIHGPLVREVILEFFSTLREPLRRLCHRLIALTILGRDELIRLRICERLVDVVTWVTLGPKRQQVRAAGGDTKIHPEAPQEHVPAGQEGVQADPSPHQVPQIPQSAAPAPKTIPQRLHRVEEEIMEVSGVRCLRFDGTQTTTLVEQIIVDGAESRLPILAKSMYDSWASHIRLFIKGKKNDGDFWETLVEGTERASYLGPERGRVYSDLSLEEKERGQGSNPWGEGTTGYGGVQKRVGNANPGRQDNAIDEDVDEQPVQDLALNVDNVFQADDCDVFNSDVDEAPTAQTMFMANLSSADPVYDEAGPSYDSDILSEDNAVPGVQIVDNSLTAELVTYKEQVELYERHARFELTEREQKIDKQLRIVITDRNFKEETLKKKLHSVKLQLASTINHNKSMVEEVTSLKKDFKQKENKYLKDFLDMKSLKEKVEDRLYKQDQSLQTVHVLCKLKPYYNELNKVAIGYKNPLCLTRIKKHDEIERKNLLIENDNLIAECLSKEVFYVATNSELNESRFTEMLVPHTIVKACCLEHEAKLSHLHDKIHKDNHNELVNRFSNLEVHHLNLQLKYQNLKDMFRNNPPIPAKDTPDFDSIFVIRKMQASLRGKDNVIKQLKTQISHLQETRSEVDRTLDFRALDSQITQLTKKVTVLQEQNDPFWAENEKIKQHYKELYDSSKIMHAKHIEQSTGLTTKNVNLKAQILNNMNSVIKDQVKPIVLAPGKYAINVEHIPRRLTFLCLLLQE
nr:hypothetical protein [Tanacetum cinerariifolium]